MLKQRLYIAKSPLFQFTNRNVCKMWPTFIYLIAKYITSKSNEALYKYFIVTQM